MTDPQEKSKGRRPKDVLEIVLMEILQWAKIDFLLILCVTFPPLAVLLVYGLHWRLFLNLFFCCLGFLPAQINAIYALSQKGVLTKNRHRRRNAKRMALEERGLAQMKHCCKHDRSEPFPDIATEPSRPSQVA